MIGVFGLFVVVDVSKDLFGGDDEVGHFPDGSFKVHGGEFEEAAEEGGEAHCGGVSASGGHISLRAPDDDIGRMSAVQETAF